VVELELAPATISRRICTSRTLAPEGEAREVVAPLLERVDADARTLDHDTRQHDATIEQGGQGRRDGETRHFQERLGVRGGPPMRRSVISTCSGTR
jgi:hypothetical protein